MTEAAAQSAKHLATTRMPQLGMIIPAAGAFASVVGLAADQGGYFPPAWGWSAFTFSVVAAIAFVVRERLALSALEMTMLAAILALAGWIGLSTLWSLDAPQSVLEMERAVVYVSALLAAVIVVGRRSVPYLLGGILCGIVAVAAYALYGRLFPPGVLITLPIGGYRLAGPLGYWNALGIFSGLGVVLAVGFAARSRVLVRALAAASLVVLLPTIYFTFSRGAALGTAVGIAVALAYDRRRLQLASTIIVVAPGPALATWLAVRSSGLTDQTATFQQAAHDGHRLAIAIVVLAVASAGLSALLAVSEPRLRFGHSLRVAYASILIGLVVAAAVAASARYGSPAALVRKAYRSAIAPQPHVTGNLSGRLTNLSNEQRNEAWSAALTDYSQHNLLGSGAGSFEEYWYQHRPSATDLSEVHNIYLEALAELGPIGLALMIVVFGVPLVAATRARGQPLAAAVIGAYGAYLVHAALDFDWEMPAITVTALFLGVSLLAFRSRANEHDAGVRIRAAGLALAVAVAAFAVVGFVGNNALAESRSAWTAENWPKAEALARKAVHWAPWSSDAWYALGQAQNSVGDRGAARRSFEQVVRKDPRDWAGWYALATVSSGRAQRRAYAQAAVLNPLSDSIIHLRRIGLLPRQ